MQLGASAAGAPALAAHAVPETIAAAVRRRVADVPAALGGYFYDLDAAAGPAAALRMVLPPWANLFYAVKANSFQPVLRALVPHVEGFEVASAGEAELAASLVAGPVRMVAAGPGKGPDLLLRLVELGVEAVNVESVLELHRLNRAAALVGRRQPVTLRVNPRRLGVSGALTMAGLPTQFGFCEADVPAALAVVGALPWLEMVGFHVHAVCNNLDAASHASYVRWCMEWSVAVARRHRIELRLLDVGGGIGVPFEGEKPFDLHRFGEQLAALRPPTGCRMVFEPGRHLVAGCGFYAAEVTDLKYAYGTWFAVVRGGINHFQLPTSWPIVHRFAVLEVERWDDPWPRPEVRDQPVTVVGELCTPEDTLVQDVAVRRLRAGDVVVFPMAGAYGYEFAMPAFLGHPPAERHGVTGAGGVADEPPAL